MQDAAPPPLLSPVTTEARVPRWRWGIHLLILTAYPLVLGIWGAINHGNDAARMLPSRVLTLLAALSIETVVFAVVCGVALLFSCCNSEELFLSWNSRFKPVIRGFVYSIGLRLFLFVIIVAIAGLTSMATGGREQIAEKLRPETEQVVDARALAKSPAYFVLNLTLVSFVFAGFREELWRAGMLAGFEGLWPGTLSRPDGRWLAVGLTAAVFGLGHLPQGWGGVLLTGALGFGLGIIILRQRSIWEAVMAHGFFNATTFLMLYAMARFHPRWIQSIAGTGFN